MLTITQSQTNKQAHKSKKCYICIIIAIVMIVATITIAISQRTKLKSIIQNASQSADSTEEPDKSWEDPTSYIIDPKQANDPAFWSRYSTESADSTQVVLLPVSKDHPYGGVPSDHDSWEYCFNAGEYCVGPLSITYSNYILPHFQNKFGYQNVAAPKFHLHGTKNYFTTLDNDLWTSTYSQEWPSIAWPAHETTTGFVAIPGDMRYSYHMNAEDLNQFQGKKRWIIVTEITNMECFQDVHPITGKQRLLTVRWGSEKPTPGGKFPDEVNGFDWHIYARAGYNLMESPNGVIDAYFIPAGKAMEQCGMKIVYRYELIPPTKQQVEELLWVPK